MGDDVSDERGAIDWLIALQEHPEDEVLQAEHRGWLAESAANRAQWDEVQFTWSAIGLAPRSVTPVAADGGRRVRPAPGWRQHAGRHLAAAIVAVAAAVVLFVALPGIQLWLAADYATGIGETRVVALADGSEVTLGADSAIAVELTETERRVRLLKGEAFFDVFANPALPFVVDAQQTETTVYGTGFNVQDIGGTITVAVDHGSVGVDWTGGDTKRSSDRLGAGDWVAFAGTGDLVSGTVPPETIGAWRSGSLILQDRPVGDVVDAVRRNFHGQVVVTDGSLLSDRVTGVYALANPEQALRAAIHIHGGRVRQITPWLLLVDRP